MEQHPRVIRIKPADQVAVAVETLEPGTEIRIGGQTLRLREVIPAGHKLAVVPVEAGTEVFKYGFPIGVATRPIKPGQHVHVHNLRSCLEGIESYAYHPGPSVVPSQAPSVSFDGFVRPDGRAGIRNEIWVIPTVGCVNKVCQALAREAHARWATGNLDGIYAFEHPYGCSQLGGDHLKTQKLLTGLVRHPNAGGVLVVGLGCENNHLDAFKPILGDVNPERVKFLAVQEVEDEIEIGLDILEELARTVRAQARRPIPVSQLTVCLKCGGSDGFSGITANPLLGEVADRLNAMGATTLLGEVPEMFGAETLLMNRCVDEAVFAKCVALINDFKAYFARYDQPIDKNPSPGNLAGGITTLEEKSLGCVQKAGTAPVVDVLAYGDPVQKTGLNLISTPGNDMVSTTALAAAGAQLVLFTTGRGTPLGGPVPTLKVSSNTTLADRKPTWIDFDAGLVLAGVSVEVLAEQLLEQVIEIASGRQRTRNEEAGFREIAIFKDGVTL